MKPFLRNWRLTMILFFTGAFHTLGFASQMSVEQLSRHSERALYREFERARSAGQLFYAYDVLKLALDQRDAKRGRPNPHKKYSPEFQKLAAELASQISVQGLDACHRKELAVCAEMLDRAREFAETPQVEELARTLSNEHSAIRERFDVASSMAAGGRFEDALELFDSLETFQAHLPDLAEARSGAKALYVEKLLADGFAAVDARRWDEAERRFRRAESLHPNETRVPEGLTKVERGRDAERLAVVAERYLQDARHRESMDQIESALAIFPRAPWLEAQKKAISDKWAAHLAERLPALLRDRLNFNGVRDALVGLSTLARLAPDHPLVASNTSYAAENFGWASLQKALDLMAMGNPHRMATTYVLMLNAQSLLGSLRVRDEQVKDAASGFNRKRMAQLILSVENLCGAPPEFVSSVSARAQHIVEGMSLPDLRIRTREQYLRRPDEDPLFQDIRPGGMSSTALLTIGISGHMSERWSSENPERIESEYVAGSEEIENPEYREKEEELLKMVESFTRLKKDSERRVMSHRIELAKRELDRIDRTKSIPKLAPYTYLTVSHRQEAEVEMVLTLRDFVSKESLYEDSIKESDRRTGEHTEGVHEQDAHSIRNEPLRMPTPEQILGSLERQALDSLEKKLPGALAVFIDRHFDEGRRLLQAGRRADAVEFFLSHWAFLRGNLNEDQAKLVVRAVQEETGFDLESQGAALLSMVERVAPLAP